MGPAHPSRNSLPAALRRHVVVQDYSRYEPADQATWRFILLHLVEHLRHRAHPRYLEGLKRAGLSTERIPRIEEVDDALGELGWSAVCVSGFVPPRAFQRFQAMRVLPIAGDIRAPWHVAYTPAPDIVHEAAGHAPLIVDPVYADYLQRIGELGELAFSSQQDLAVHEAVAGLSDLKERTSSSDPAITRAERHLEAVLREQAQSHQSEATRMSRLYWWTAEYGLVGTPEDFKVYGAGLLSSLGEAVYCESPEVQKRELDVRCLDVAFDITRPQPQLFVVRDFERLFDVLDEARQLLSSVAGGAQSLRSAQRSGLPCAVQLSTGHVLRGRLASFGEGRRQPSWLCFERDATMDGEVLAERGSESEESMRDLSQLDSRSVVIPLGDPESRPSWKELSERASSDGMLDLTYEGGHRIKGTLKATAGQEQRGQLLLQDVTVQCDGREYRYDHYLLPWGARVERAIPDDEEAQEAANSMRPPAVVPATRMLNDRDSALRQLYARADQAWRSLDGAAARDALLGVQHDLDRDFPEDWLLRWNLLESLLKLGDTEHTAALERELERLEVHHHYRQPIATGLRSLKQRIPANDSMEDAS